jgi:hypothetical protein
MDIFIQTETNTTIPIEIEAHWTVGDLKDALRGHSAPLLSYQGVELNDSSVPIADTGICSESVVNMISRRAWMAKSGHDVIIIDTVDNEIHHIDDNDYDVYIDSNVLTKTDHGKYEFGICNIIYKYQLSIEFITETSEGVKFYPVDSFDIIGNINNDAKKSLDSIRQKYTEFTFNIKTDPDRFASILALATRGY